jgi:REase_MTES_1575/Transcriptional regulator, AbiEi antitoxin
VASRQYSVFSRSQAVAAGMTPKMITRRLEAGRWEVVDSGVYGIAGTPPSWHRRLLAACLAGPAVASHRSAGLLWRFPDMPEGIVEVTALRHRRRRASDVIWHESYLLMPDQVTEIEGIQGTGAVRTFLDLAGVLDAEPLEAVCNDGIRRGLFTAFSALGELERLGPLRRGAPLARALLESRRPGERPPESLLETRFLQLVRKAGLPVPVAQYELRAGGNTLRVDFAYPHVKLAIELDGEEFHWGERADRRDNDRNNLLGTIGWRVLRFTWSDIHQRPQMVLARLRPALAQTA